MKRFFKWLGLALLALICLTLVLTYTPDKSADELIAKYGGEQAKWAPMPGGPNIHYRDQGPKGASVIVMIHGMSSHLQTWEPLIAEMGGEYRYLSMDLPGFGITGPNPAGTYGAEVYGAAVIAVMDAAGVDKALITGNSMGGWTAWRMGLIYPERINGLVLIDAWGAPGENTEKSNLGFRLMQTSFGKAVMPHFTPRFLVKQSTLQSVEKDEVVTEDMVDRYHDLLRFPGNRKASLVAMSTSGNRDTSPWDNIGTLEMPILILWGRDDQLISVDRAARFTEKLPQAELIIYEGVGHLPMEEIPVEAAVDIRAWMAKSLHKG